MALVSYNEDIEARRPDYIPRRATRPIYRHRNIETRKPDFTSIHKDNPYETIIKEFEVFLLTVKL